MRVYRQRRLFHISRCAANYDVRVCRVAKRLLGNSRLIWVEFSVLFMYKAGEEQGSCRSGLVGSMLSVNALLTYPTAVLGRESGVLEYYERTTEGGHGRASWPFLLRARHVVGCCVRSRQEGGFRSSSSNGVTSFRHIRSWPEVGYGALVAKWKIVRQKGGTFSRVSRLLAASNSFGRQICRQACHFSSPGVIRGVLPKHGEIKPLVLQPRGESPSKIRCLFSLREKGVNRRQAIFYVQEKPKMSLKRKRLAFLPCYSHVLDYLLQKNSVWGAPRRRVDRDDRRGHRLRNHCTG